MLQTQIQLHRKKAVYQPGTPFTISYRNTRLPFLVVEAAHSQTSKSVRKKVHYWLQGSKQHLKYIVNLRALNVHEPSTSVHMHAGVLKPRAVDANFPGHPLGFRVEKGYVLRNVEMYPREPNQKFPDSLLRGSPKSLGDATLRC